MPPPGLLLWPESNKSGGLKTNKEYFSPGIDWVRAHATANDGSAADDPRRELLFDPQTSGGLLIAVSASSAIELLENLAGRGIQAVVIGSVQTAGTTRLKIG